MDTNITYQLTIESVQKIAEIQRLLNLIEIKGANNVSLMYTSMVLLQDVVADIRKNEQPEGIIIDNTKET